MQVARAVTLGPQAAG